MKDIQEARNYAKKHNIKLVQHRNGNVTIRFKKRHQGGSHENFWNGILRLMRGVKKRLGPEYEYVPSAYNFRGQYPEKIIKVKFKRRKTE